MSALKNPSSYYNEFVDPMLPSPRAFAIRAEHLGRYLFAKRFLSKKKIGVVYDIACGDGYGTKILSSVCKKIYGLDVSEKFLAVAKKHYTGTNITYIYKDLEKDLSWNTQTSDAIVSLETLEHVENPVKLLLSFNHLLKQNGYLILSTPNAQMEPKKNGKSKNPYHKHIFKKDELLNIVKNAGFNIEGIYGQPYTNILMHKNNRLMSLLNTITYRCLFLFKMFVFLGMPTKNNIDKSYSIIIVARKK